MNVLLQIQNWWQLSCFPVQTDGLVLHSFFLNLKWLLNCSGFRSFLLFSFKDATRLKRGNIWGQNPWQQKYNVYFSLQDLQTRHPYNGKRGNPLYKDGRSFFLYLFPPKSKLLKHRSYSSIHLISTLAVLLKTKDYLIGQLIYIVFSSSKPLWLPSPRVINA